MLTFAMFLLVSSMALAVRWATQHRFGPQEGALLAFSSGTGNTGYFGLPVALILLPPRGCDAVPVLYARHQFIRVYGGVLLKCPRPLLGAPEPRQNCPPAAGVCLFIGTAIKRAQRHPSGVADEFISGLSSHLYAAGYDDHRYDVEPSHARRVGYALCRHLRGAALCTLAAGDAGGRC